MHDLIASSTLSPAFAVRAARHLPPTFGLLVGRLVSRLGAWLCRRAREARWRRDAHAVEAALRELDPRSLRDLGFHPDEISSVAAEMSGRADITRIRVALSTPLLR